MMSEDEYLNAPLKERLTWKYACGPAGPCNDRLFAKEEIDRLELRIAELEAALKPFAARAVYIDAIDYNLPMEVKAIHLHAARKALEKGDE